MDSVFTTKCFGDDSMTYYEILGIDKNADKLEIKSAFRRLSKVYHPDLNHDNGAREMFQSIYSAYEVLYDEVRRAKYDCELADLAKKRENSSNQEANKTEKNYSYSAPTSNGTKKTNNSYSEPKSTDTTKTNNSYSPPKTAETKKINDNFAKKIKHFIWKIIKFFGQILLSIGKGIGIVVLSVTVGIIYTIVWILFRVSCFVFGIAVLVCLAALIFDKEMLKYGVIVLIVSLVVAILSGMVVNFVESKK